MLLCSNYVSSFDIQDEGLIRWLVAVPFYHQISCEQVEFGLYDKVQAEKMQLFIKHCGFTSS